jgi:hypothetical protein
MALLKDCGQKVLVPFVANTVNGNNFHSKGHEKPEKFYGCEMKKKKDTACRYCGRHNEDMLTSEQLNKDVDKILRSERFKIIKEKLKSWLRKKPCPK